MTKITNIEDKTYQGKVTGHIITLADGTTGYLADKVSDSVVVGDDVSCLLEVKRNKQGGEYNLLTLKKIQQGAPDQPPRPAIHVGAGKSKQELKCDASIQVFIRLMDEVKAGKMGTSVIASELREFSQYIWAEIDEAFK